VLELQDLVEEVGTALEGELLGQDEGVVAVEEEGGDLMLLVKGSQFGCWRRDEVLWPF